MNNLLDSMHRPHVAFDFEIIQEPYSRGIRVVSSYMPDSSMTPEEIKEFEKEFKKFMLKNKWKCITD